MSAQAQFVGLEPCHLEWRAEGFTPQESRVMELLRRRVRRGVSRQSLLTAMYGNDDGPENESKCLDILILRIRRRLEAQGIPYKVRTLPFFGYQMESTC